MSSDSSDFYVWVTVAFFGGLYSFFKGFRIYREYRRPGWSSAARR